MMVMISDKMKLSQTLIYEHFHNQWSFGTTFELNPKIANNHHLDNKQFQTQPKHTIKRQTL